MDCPTCHKANPADAAFCMSCWTSLSSRCPACDTELPDDVLFCFRCGHKIPGEPSEGEDGAQPRLHQYIPKELLTKLGAARETAGIEEDRRVVTMLFCDVNGSTAAAERLDPEDWHEIMNGAFEHLIAPVYRD